MRVASPDPEALARAYRARQEAEREERREAARRVQLGARQALIREEAEADEEREAERCEREAEREAEREREFAAEQERQRAWGARLAVLRERVAEAEQHLDGAGLRDACERSDAHAVAKILQDRAAWQAIHEHHAQALREHEQAGGLRRRG